MAKSKFLRNLKSRANASRSRQVYKVETMTGDSYLYASTTIARAVIQHRRHFTKGDRDTLGAAVRAVTLLGPLCTGAPLV